MMPSAVVMPTIVWDVDDVLNNLTQAWFEQAWRPAHPHGALQYDELTENPPHHILGVTLQEYLESLDAFRWSRAGRNLTPVPATLDWFQKYGSRFHHLALTATPRFNAPHSAAWVLENFGDWIREFRFIPSPRADQTLPLYDPSKAECLRRLGHIHGFVDDNPAHITAALELGIRGVTMPRPWNSARQQSIAQTLATLV